MVDDMIDTAGKFPVCFVPHFSLSLTLSTGTHAHTSTRMLFFYLKQKKIIEKFLMGHHPVQNHSSPYWINCFNLSTLNNDMSVLPLVYFFLCLWSNGFKAITRWLDILCTLKQYKWQLL